MPHSHRLPIIALLTSSLVWGLVWYPFRVLEDIGVSVASATLACYLIALLIGAAIFGRRSLKQLHLNRWLPLIALAAGWTNFGYALGVTQGQVLRVMLLFFTAPLWTVLFSRLFLGENLNRVGAAVVALSFGGAVVMLWNPSAGWPQLDSPAEWYGLSAGMMFALTNVLIKKDAANSIEIKSTAVWLGVCLVSGVWLTAYPTELSWGRPDAIVQIGAIVAPLALAILAANLVVQYGLMHTPANQAVVIMLFELVVAAVSAWLLDGEGVSLREGLGGSMIIGASLFSGRISRQPVG